MSDTRKRAAKAAPEAVSPFGEQMVRTDDLTRSPASQMRMAPDPYLVAEYAQAMIEGAKFPPVVIFQDARGDRYLADGVHRTDAAALAALREPGRRAEVLADVRIGTIDDAILHALRANHQHGRRMVEGDYTRAIRLAIERGLVVVEHAKDVVPAIVALCGCSVRTAQLNSLEMRQEMIAKRDRLIWSMHEEGNSGEAISKALEVSTPTVSNVINRIFKKRSVALSEGQPKRSPPLNPLVEDVEEEQAVAPAGDAPRHVIDMSPLLPMMERVNPMKEPDLESGAVGELADVSAAADDPAALASLASLEADLLALLTGLTAAKLDGLKRPFTKAAAAAAIERIDDVWDYLDELRVFLKQEQSS